MKRVIVFAIASLISVGAIAAQKTNNVSLKYKNFTLAFVHQPQSDGKLLPLIDGVAGKEHFGINFARADGASPVIEILDAKGSVVKALSVNDILGKGVPKEEELLPRSSSARPRRAANFYAVRLPQGDALVVMKAIATGEESGDDQQLVVTFALRADQSMKASLRVTLPFTGNTESAKRGFVIAPKAGNAAMAVSVFPQPQTTRIERGGLVISSDVKSTEPSRETPFLWLVIKGVSSSSSNDAKTQALKVIQENTLGSDEPQLVVVNAADKEKLAQADTAAYTLVCANIGTGAASDVVLGNPIPKGARYVEGSATTEGTEFNIERSSPANERQSLKWTLTEPLKPGEERIVSFKVVLE